MFSVYYSRNGLFLIQGSHLDMEKSWDMKTLAKSHVILLSVLEFYKLYQICVFFATTKKLSIDVERPYFPMFSTKCHECKIDEKDGHGKLRNGHGTVMDKYFVKSVGTLVYVPVVMVHILVIMVHMG